MYRLPIPLSAVHSLSYYHEMLMVRNKSQLTCNRADKEITVDSGLTVDSSYHHHVTLPIYCICSDNEFKYNELYESSPLLILCDSTVLERTLAASHTEAS
jgi:hypothetical protein